MFNSFVFAEPTPAAGPPAADPEPPATQPAHTDADGRREDEPWHQGRRKATRPHDRLRLLRADVPRGAQEEAPRRVCDFRRILAQVCRTMEGKNICFQPKGEGGYFFKTCNSCALSVS